MFAASSMIFTCFRGGGGNGDEGDGSDGGDGGEGGDCDGDDGSKNGGVFEQGFGGESASASSGA